MPTSTEVRSANMKKLWSDPAYREKRNVVNLTDEDVREIRNLLTNRVPQREISSKFKISQGLVSGIKHGHNFANVK